GGEGVGVDAFAGQERGVTEVEDPGLEGGVERVRRQGKGVTGFLEVGGLQCLVAEVLEPLAHGVFGRFGEVPRGRRGQAREVEPARAARAGAVEGGERIALRSLRIPRKRPPQLARPGQANAPAFVAWIAPITSAVRPRLSMNSGVRSPRCALAPSSQRRMRDGV